MSKSGMSADFAKFAAKTTKGSYDEARQAERFGRGIPFPIGTKGTAVVGALVCDQTKADPQTGEQFQRVRIELLIETPESHRGKPLTGGYFVMKDSTKVGSTWTAENWWGSMLGTLEDLGCPEELTKGYSDFQEVIDWFEAEPRNVSFEIVANNYTKNGAIVQGKQVNAFAAFDEGSIPSAEGTPEAHDPSATYCTFRGTKHRVASEDGGNITIVNVNSQTQRTVPKVQVTMI